MTEGEKMTNYKSRVGNLLSETNEFIKDQQDHVKRTEEPTERLPLAKDKTILELKKKKTDKKLSRVLI